MILGQRLVVAGLVGAFTRNVPESGRPFLQSCPDVNSLFAGFLPCNIRIE